MGTLCKQNNSSLAASTGIFIWFLQVGRQSLRLSVDQAARLAGMETADWQAIEAGRLPEPEQLRSMADVLQLRVGQLTVLDRLRRKG